MEQRIMPGVMSAFLTPFDENGKIKERAIGELVDFQVERGLDGIYVCGSTGEGMVMNEEERMQVAENVVKAVKGRVQVIIHVGTPDTGAAVRLAKHAKQIGAQGISAVPPYYYKHHKEFVKEYYRDIAAATDLPFLVYHVPSQTVGLTYETLTELMEIPHIAGMKYTEDNLEVMCRFKEQMGKDYLAFMGHDAMLLSGLVLGASGGIGAFYNVMPKGFSAVYEAFRQGDLNQAVEEQHRINHFITLMKKYMLSANQAPLKAVLRAYGVDCGMPRRPVLPLELEKEESLVAELKKEHYFEFYA